MQQSKKPNRQPKPPNQLNQPEQPRQQNQRPVSAFAQREPLSEPPTSQTAPPTSQTAYSYRNGTVDRDEKIVAVSPDDNRVDRPTHIYSPDDGRYNEGIGDDGYSYIPPF